MSTPAEPLDYLVAHIRSALIADEHLAEQAVQVEASGDRIVLRGAVATEERRELARRLAEELAEGRVVVDVMVVLAAGRRLDPEIL